VTTLGRDICDIAIRGRSMAYVFWDFEHSIWKLTLRRANERHEPHVLPAGLQLIGSRFAKTRRSFHPTDSESRSLLSVRARVRSGLPGATEPSCAA
jgi:hypothetical protein